MNILSVDWDFFFPDTRDYDWGHKEIPFFLEAIWPLRTTNRNIRTGEHVLDVFRPDEDILTKFWDTLLENTEYPSLVVAESHLDAFNVLKNLFSITDELWNFDAHHDLGYNPCAKLKTEEKECGNWAKFALSRAPKNFVYRQFFPEWRKTAPDSPPCITSGQLKKVKIQYGLPRHTIPSFDVIFVCRSSAWTPSWCDSHWMLFLDGLKGRFPSAWRNKVAVEWVLKERPFSLEDAYKSRDQQESLLGSG